MVAKSLDVAAPADGGVGVEAGSLHLSLAAKGVDLPKRAEGIGMKMLLGKALGGCCTQLYGMVVLRHSRAGVLKG